ncbi:YIP1 family protein [Capnocytophaga catalasegens]|uniref:Yip1 domain-containing protein n=1 Tax=Capnocytophaga catalasegens TaxID=1004260 RepID=A0AAV5B1A2_9FLAO|nr:YIP1 family protein [Capnocytophaga catalasegens]GIZ15605.1 hypothetical protein RCZ03_16050 [Capnocytophaga catalasegens]GJM51532.1 hypothetical protein RCZ15_25050 [Capnocytophaga catalasegens]GJM54163.1 hypothetical protein RCZ16_24790 [Capnocytophaga catalasegens]
MQQFIEKIQKIPKGYAILVIVTYSFLITYFFYMLNQFYFSEIERNSILSLMLKINYVVIFFSGIIVWIIMSLLFHLTALLFEGQGSFSKFLYTSSYFYLIPTLFIFVAIIILDYFEQDLPFQVLQNHMYFKISIEIINYSYIPYYILNSFLIKEMYKIVFWKSIIVISIPIISIWAITVFFSWIF